MSERTDIAAPAEESRALALPSAGNVIQSILAAAKDPNVDADKVKTLHDLAVGMLDRERAAEFNRAKIAAIREMPAIYKRGKSDKHRYAKFEDLHRAVMPILARHGLTLDFKVGNDGGAIAVQPILRHENGWVEEGGTMRGPPDQGPGRTPIQAIASSTSYLKRHSMKAILNLIEDGEDDDGNYGFREGEQRTDRQDRLILDAEAAAVTGDYETFYRGLSAKDKAFLVRIGVHGRCGGGTVALPPTTTSPIGRGEQEPEDAEVEEVVEEPKPKAEPPAADEPEPEPKPEPETEPDPTTPEGWTAIFERNCRDAETPERLADVEKAAANALRKLSEQHTALWERADRALLEAKDRLKNPPAAGLFGEEPAK